MPIVCVPVADAAGLTDGIGGTVRTADDLAAVSRMLQDDPTESIVVIGPRTADDEAMEFAATLRIRRPGSAVVLVRRQVDVVLLTRALQSGVREVVTFGDKAALAAACDRVRELLRHIAPPPATEPERRREGQIVTVFAAKGGCGKTTLAVNLGVALTQGTGNRVCVVDLDLAFGDVAISVQLDPARTIMDALPMAGRLDASAVTSLLTRYRPGLETLLGPVTPNDAEKIPPSLVGELLAVLRQMFDFVVVDTPPQLSEHVLTAMDASTHLVLLTTPDVAALKNLRLTLDMLDMLSYPQEVRSVLLNRADAKVGLTIEDVRRVVRCPIGGQVPSSHAVPVSVNKGRPITLSDPRHAVSRAIFRFAHEHVLDVAPAARSTLFARLRKRKVLR